MELDDVLQQSGLLVDDGQRVVDLVGHAGGEAADGGELLLAYSTLCMSSARFRLWALKLATNWPLPQKITPRMKAMLTMRNTSSRGRERPRALTPNVGPDVDEDERGVGDLEHNR